jgi:hypothetical protein
MLYIIKNPYSMLPFDEVPKHLNEEALVIINSWEVKEDEKIVQTIITNSY